MMQYFGSLWLTLILLVAAGLLALVSRLFEVETGFWYALPFSGLFLNLIAALFVHEGLRRKAGLLGFHLSLAGLALLLAWDALSGFTGNVRVTVGTSFDPLLVEDRAQSPLHVNRTADIVFTQGPFYINYDPGMKRRETVSLVHLPGGDVEVGDDKPLLIAGYRLYTSFNKGFAPVFTYTPTGGQPMTVAVHMPHYPMNFHDQSFVWQGPVTLKLWLQLQEDLFKEEAAWTLAGPPQDAKLVVIEGAARTELDIGQSVTVEGGTLKYEELRTWMGYEVVSAPMTPFMVGAIVVGMLFLIWHYMAQFISSGWLRGADRSKDSL